MDNSGVWVSHNDQTLSSGGQDDFQNFMDINMSNLGDGINFDFQDFAAQQNEQSLHRDIGEGMDIPMDGINVDLMAGKDHMMQDNLMAMPMSNTMPLLTHPTVDMSQATNNNILDLDTQIHFLQQQRHQQQIQLQVAERQRQQQEQQQQQNFYAQQRMVPPTPNSMEMHGNVSSQYYGQSDQAYESRYQLRLKDQELAFTPLVSPAVTPLETHFNLPDYAMPTAYFSPLSSPALHAQQEHQRYNVTMDNSSAIASPIDLDIDLNAHPPSTGPTPQKPSRKAPPKSKSRSVRQSPIVKPQRRKPGSTVISPQALTDILEPASTSQTPRKPAILMPQPKPQPSSLRPVSGSGHRASVDSVSPEQLTDMAPPPIPKSKSSSALVGQNQRSATAVLLTQANASPATPASLMRLAKSQQTSPATDRTKDDSISEDHTMEDFALPEPANPRPSQSDAPPSSTVTTSMNDVQVPGSAIPSSVMKSQSARSSPALRPQTSDASLKSKTTPLLRATPRLAVRGTAPSQPNTATSNKKRASISSNVLISPALRPKLSPSLGPTNRGPGFSAHNITDDTASQLLAVKSNYQNILEGTHLPGVSYPSELSTNLTSKRTSHKIAEQGRRNRINSALTEMAALLPHKSGTETTPSADDIDDGSCSGKKGDKESKSAQSSNSKASTVEHAIEYIKQLQKEVEDVTKRAELAEEKLSSKT